MNRRSFLSFAAIAPAVALAPLDAFVLPVEELPVVEWVFGVFWGEWGVRADNAWPGYTYPATTTIMTGTHGTQDDARERLAKSLASNYPKTRNVIR